MERRELDLEDPTPSSPGEIETRIHDESVQPGIEPVRVAKPAQVRPCPDRRLLDRVARELGVPEDQSGGRVQSRQTPADERAEGLMIALARPLDELCLVHVGPSIGAADTALIDSDARSVAYRSRGASSIVIDDR